MLPQNGIRSHAGNRWPRGASGVTWLLVIIALLGVIGIQYRRLTARALMDAVVHPDARAERAVRALVRRGADEEVSGEQRVSILEFAVVHGLLDVARQELDRGVDPNSVLHGGIGGSSALLTAVQCHRLDIVRLLLDRGADPNARSPGGTVLGYVVGGQYAPDFRPAIESLLRSHGARVGFDEAVALGSARDTEWWLERGVDVNLPFRGGDMPLSRAAGSHPMTSNIKDRS